MFEPDAMQAIHCYRTAASELMRGCCQVEQIRRHVVFTGGKPLTDGQLDLFCHVAVERNADIVHLEFDDRISLGLRHAMIVTPTKGGGLVYADLAFWSSPEQGPMVLASTKGHRSHFAWTIDGLEHRKSKVAPSLAGGFRRASRLLDRAAEQLEDWPHRTWTAA